MAHDPITESRRLARFPEEPNEQNTLTLAEWQQTLLSPTAPGFLIHGGPGSGKSHLLRDIFEHLNPLQDTMVVDAINMGAFQSQSHANFILQEIVDRIIRSAEKETEQISRPGQPLRHLTLDQLFDLFSQTVSALATVGIRRLILLLDNFEHLRSWTASELGHHLRRMYDTHKEAFTFVLTAATDLSELYTEDHIYSPLNGITDSYVLLDLDDEISRTFIHGLTQRYGADLTPAEISEIVREANGYPALLAGLVQRVAQGRRQGRPFTIAQAVEKLCQEYYAQEPLRTVTRDFENVTHYNRGVNPATILDILIRENTSPPIESLPARMLLAMGVFRWRRGRLTWRNRIMRRFWQEKHGQALLARWLQRPFPFENAQLSAQGTVYVSLLYDLGDLLEQSEHFNLQRGSTTWITDLKALANAFPFPGPFRRWDNQDHYSNLGHDLNLFRTDIIRHAFTPIYEANVNDLNLHFDGRIRDLKLESHQANAIRTILHTEMHRWNRVRLQIGRDGVVVIHLIREIDEPRPLMGVMDDLLGLERELSDQTGYEELSVQWELALAILDRFVQQIQPQRFNNLLRVRWDGPQVKRDQPLYANRDRYIIYQFRKLCNCHPGPNLRSSSERRIVRVNDIEPIYEPKEQTTTEAWNEAYNYGRELTSLLEGVMIAPQNTATSDGDIGLFPTIKLRDVRQFLKRDHATWENELFSISLDNALILYTTTDRVGELDPEENEGQLLSSNKVFCRGCAEYQRQQITQLYFPQRMVPYEDYWQCIIMGLHYLLELRWMTQWAARRTTRALRKMADLMGTEHDNWEEIQTLMQKERANARILSHLREATIPLSIASADYAVHKYETFIKQSGLREIIANGEKDIEAINAFLRHAEAQHQQKMFQAEQEQREQERQDAQTRREAINRAELQMQERLRKRAQAINQMFTLGGGSLAVLALVVTLPSLWIDFEDSVIGRYFFPATAGQTHPLLLPFLMALTVFIIAMVGIGIWWLWQQMGTSDEAQSDESP